jgi:hypothetical protein
MIMKVLVIILSLFITTVANADVASQALNKVSEKISNLIPGEGITEVSLDYNDGDDDQINFSILGVRDIEKTNSSNFFTQFSLMNSEVNGTNRIFTNIGLGNRVLTDNKSMMLGTNVFFDTDLLEKHKRASLGIEAKAHMLDLNLNFYEALSNTITVDKTDEKVLSGHEFGISSQIPYMPWAKVNYTDYLWEKDQASVDTEGKIYSLEMQVSPSISIEGSLDESGNTGVDDETSFRIAFIYPPKENEPSAQDGLSNVAFEKRDMSKELSKKVRRNNKIVLETQGTIIVTSK